jgi:hypothetical protein
VRRLGILVASILAASIGEPPPVRTYRAEERDPEPESKKLRDLRSPKTHPTRITKRQARRLKGRKRRIID